MEKPGREGRVYERGKPMLPAVVVTMMMVNRGVGRHNRTSQNRERKNRKQKPCHFHWNASWDAAPDDY